MNKELLNSLGNDWNGNQAIEALDRAICYCIFYNDEDENLLEFANIISLEVNSDELYYSIIYYDKYEVIAYIKESGYYNNIDEKTVNNMLDLYNSALDIVADEYK